MSDTPIIRRPSAIAKQIVESILSVDPADYLLEELAEKTELTSCEAQWFKHALADRLVESVPA